LNINLKKKMKNEKTCGQQAATSSDLAQLSLFNRPVSSARETSMTSERDDLQAKSGASFRNRPITCSFERGCPQSNIYYFSSQES